jgi:hypothetical protein
MSIKNGQSPKITESMNNLESIYVNYKQRVRKEHNWNGTGTHESNIYN